jgi:hypothetical protein
VVVSPASRSRREDVSLLIGKLLVG